MFSEKVRDANITDFFLTFQLGLFLWWKVTLAGMMTPYTDATTCTVLTVTVADHPVTVIVAPTRKTRSVSIGISLSANQTIAFA